MRESILPGKLFFLLPTIKVIAKKVLIQRRQREREKGEWINIHSIYQTWKKNTLDENKAHDEVEWWDPHIDVYSLNEKTPEIDKFEQKPAYSSFY